MGDFLTSINLNSGDLAECNHKKYQMAIVLSLMGDLGSHKMGTKVAVGKTYAVYVLATKSSYRRWSCPTIIYGSGVCKWSEPTKRVDTVHTSRMSF